MTSMPPRAARPALVAAAAAALAILALGCGKQAEPAGPPAAPAATAPAGPAPEEAQVGQAPPPPAVPPGDRPLPPGPPADLPAGTTLGDALPPLPPPAPRLGSGEAAAARYPATGCADLGPAGYELGKRLEITLPPPRPGDLPDVLEACLFARNLARPDRAGRTGRQFAVVGAWPGGATQSFTFDELQRAPETLPPDRARAGHDAAAWATILSTGHPERPVLAIVSGRFYDGPLGEALHWRRQSRLLRKVGAKVTWDPFVDKDFATFDLPHLQALCEGRADASPADRAAKAVTDACSLHEALSAAADKGAAERLARRKKRLAGGGDAGKPDDPDPQALAIRAAKKALAAGDTVQAVEQALRADVACGEPVTEAHALIADALRAARLAPARVQPGQPTVDLCEPLADKPAPKRQKVEGR